MTRPRVALVTAVEARDLDEDLPPLAAALARCDVDAEVEAWDDPAVDWAGYDLAVVRSTWNYPRQRDIFLDWADRVAAATALANPVAVLRWNTDKRYLADLAGAGVAVVNTSWYEPGQPFGPTDLPDGEFVVKPAVSAGSQDTARHTSRDRGADHVRDLLAVGRVVMVQPYHQAVDTAGETGLIYVAGQFSHGFRKGPLLAPDGGMVDGLFAMETLTSRAPTAAEEALADATLAAVPAFADTGGRPLLYARVDMVPDAAGEPCLLELELTEPSLFHGQAAGSEDVFAAAIAARVSGG